MNGTAIVFGANGLVGLGLYHFRRWRWKVTSRPTPSDFCIACTQASLFGLLLLQLSAKEPLQRVSLWVGPHDSLCWVTLDFLCVEPILYNLISIIISYIFLFFLWWDEMLRFFQGENYRRLLYERVVRLGGIHPIPKRSHYIGFIESLTGPELNERIRNI